MDRTRITILSLNYAPEAIGIGPYSAGLAQHLAAQGNAVQVVAGRPYYPQWSPHSGYRSLWNTRREHGVTVTRCPHYIPRRPGGLKRILHHVSFAKSCLPIMLRAAIGRPDVVLAVAPSLIAASCALLAARICRARFWLHVQDFEVEAAISTGLARRGSLPARLGAWLERTLISQADLVTTISPQMLGKLAEKGAPAGRIAELRNWANHLDLIESADGTKLRRAWGLEDKFVALYSGNIANKQGIESVVEAAQLLSGRADIALVICGDGPQLPRLKGLAAGCDNVLFQPLQAAETFAGMMRMADCHLLPQLADAADLVLPSKLANMLASGRPIIAAAAHETGIAQEIDGCGILVTPQDPEALAKAIRSLASDPAQAARLGNAASKRARLRWTQSSILDGADGLLARLMAAE